jgi:hypothetical protein
MKIYTVAGEFQVGIGGAFVRGLATSYLNYFFPERSASPSDHFQFGDFEIVSFSDGGLYAIDIKNLSYAILAQHHFTAAVSEGRGCVLFLMEQEIASFNQESVATWSIPIESWLNFERRLFEENAAQLGFADFCNSPPDLVSIVSFLPLRETE